MRDVNQLVLYLHAVSIRCGIEAFGNHNVDGYVSKTHCIFIELLRDKNELRRDGQQSCSSTFCFPRIYLFHIGMQCHGIPAESPVRWEVATWRATSILELDPFGFSAPTSIKTIASNHCEARDERSLLSRISRDSEYDPGSMIHELWWIKQHDGNAFTFRTPRRPWMLHSTTTCILNTCRKRHVDVSMSKEFAVRHMKIKSVQNAPSALEDAVLEDIRSVVSNASSSCTLKISYMW